MENRIAELRKEKGMTLKQLGETLGVRDNTLSQYETGKRNPQLGLLQEIADLFQVSIEYLTKNTDKRDGRKGGGEEKDSQRNKTEQYCVSQRFVLFTVSMADETVGVVPGKVQDHMGSVDSRGATSCPSASTSNPRGVLRKEKVSFEDK